MAILFVDSLGENKSRFVQKSCKMLELVLLSVGLFSTLIVMKEAVVPYSCRIVFSSLIGFCTLIKCFLSSPLTIIITINLMVLLIFASSAFHQTTQLLPPDDESPPPPPWDAVEVTPPPPPETAPKATIANTTSSTSLQALFSSQDIVPHPPPPEKWKDVFIENEEEETMEATWETITGRGKKQKPKPKKKKLLKKSETWDAPPPPRRLDSEEVLPTSPKWKELRKAETFNDAVSVMRRGGLIRRDPSISLEEFNHKVEKFINNFNDTMRLQRQESMKKFLGIINQKRF